MFLCIEYTLNGRCLDTNRTNRICPYLHIDMKTLNNKKYEHDIHNSKRYAKLKFICKKGKKGKYYLNVENNTTYFKKYMKRCQIDTLSDCKNATCKYLHKHEDVRFNKILPLDKSDSIQNRLNQECIRSEKYKQQLIETTRELSELKMYNSLIKNKNKSIRGAINSMKHRMTDCIQQLQEKDIIIDATVRQLQEKDLIINAAVAEVTRVLGGAHANKRKIKNLFDACNDSAIKKMKII